MVEFKSAITGLATGSIDLTGGLSLEMEMLITVFGFALIIAFYSIFTFKFYRFISKKDLISLDLNQYNTSKHPVLNKTLACFFYLLEYIIILPFLIFFWFAVLSLILFILSSESAEQVIVVAAAIIVAIRMLSYYSQDLSRDLAKMFPFTILTIFVLGQGFFDTARITDNLAQINQIEIITALFYFLILIVAVELILRMLDLIRGFWTSEEERPSKVRKKDEDEEA